VCVRESVFVKERERGKESASVYMCKYVCLKEREGESVYVCEMSTKILRMALFVVVYADKQVFT